MLKRLTLFIKEITNLDGHIDTDAAELMAKKLLKDLEFYDEIVVDRGRNKSVLIEDLLPKTESVNHGFRNDAV